MAWCLTKEAEAKLLEALKADGNPQKMVDRGSEGRRKCFAQFGEENAKNLNIIFESKMLLKNQQRGLQSFVKGLGGSKEIKRDFLSKLERLETALSKKELDQYLGDYTSKRLGLDAVSEEQFKKITKISQKVKDKKATWDTKWQGKDWVKDNSWKNDSDRLDWGAAQIELGNFVNDLKDVAGREGIKSYLNPAKAVVELGGIAKTTKATLDLSAIFRQGWKTIWTNPLVWQKNARNSFANFVSTLKNRGKVMDAINADIISRPYHDIMVKSKLAIGTVEEAFPTRLPQRIPLFGRVVEASDTAFTGFAYKQRPDIFEANLKLAQKVGVNINDVKKTTPIANMINALTGRATLPGDLERSANVVNNLFFAPRFVASQVQLFTQPFTGAGGSNFVRKQATKNLIQVVAGTAGVLMLAKAILPDSVEEDPTSSDFGQIKIGNTRFDVTGGHRTLVTLAMRLIKQKTKSTTGAVSELNTGTFGSRTGVDVAFDFAQNKLSPVASIIRDLLRGENFDGEKPTIAGTANDLLTPLPITNYLELKNDPNSAPLLLGILAESVGIGTNTYGKSETSWEKSTGKELTQFKEKVGPDKFKEANDTFNKKYDEWFQGVVKNPVYQNLSDDDKRALLSNAKEDIKDKIFKEYRFNYKTEKNPASEKRLIKSLEPI